jgi:hypothetical protein
MGSLFLLDPEGGAAEILEDLDEAARFGGGRQAQLGPSRDDHIFLSADQYRPGMDPGRDDVARLERGAAHGGGHSSPVLHLDRSRRLGHPPRGGGGEGAVTPEEQEQDEGAQEHGQSPSAAAARARAARLRPKSLRRSEGAWLRRR